ncbi:unnamed protein product, partial [marine sediment metagenome]
QIAVRDEESYTAAAETLKDIARIEKLITEHHKPIKQAAKNAHSIAVAAEKKFLDPLTKAKSIIRNSLVVWTTEQERIRRDAERKLQAEARRKEEEERLALAERAEDEGKSETEVTEILDTPAPVPPVIVSPTFNKVAGVSTRETWRAEVTDMKMLCRAVVDGKAPVETVSPNMPLLNSMARKSKSGLGIPGVKAIKDTGVAIRS